MQSTEARMTLVDEALAVALAVRVLGGRAGAVVYVDRAPNAAGTVTLGVETHTLDRPSLSVFRDELPGANWMHPCTYALVDLQTGEPVLTVAADRPPAFGRLPDSWVVAAGPLERADLAPL